LVNELAEAAERRLSRIVARYGRLICFCSTNWAVQLDSRGSELLFRSSPGAKKASVAVASNLPFSEWGQIIPDPRLVAHRRSCHLQRPHHRNRHRQLPVAHHPPPDQAEA
jgi:hypothetical protein